MTARGGTNYSLSDYTATMANLNGYRAGDLLVRQVVGLAAMTLIGIVNLTGCRFWPIMLGI